ncbi:hypothetical protein HNP40_001068 [Mycobacteroides chelonae]|nr:hypothetical protein [Mycobacteroides chelonae]
MRIITDADAVTRILGFGLLALIAFSIALATVSGSPPSLASIPLW